MGVRASSLHSSNVEMCSQDGRTTNHASIQVTETWVGGTFKPLTLKPLNPKAQPRWPHHKSASPIPFPSRLSPIVVRASSLHSSTIRPTEISNLQSSIFNQHPCYGVTIDPPAPSDSGSHSVIAASMTAATTGAAVVAPPPPCSTIAATTRRGSSRGAQPTNRAWCWR